MPPTNTEINKAWAEENSLAVKENISGLVARRDEINSKRQTVDGAWDKLNDLNTEVDDLLEREKEIIETVGKTSGYKTPYATGTETGTFFIANFKNSDNDYDY